MEWTGLVAETASGVNVEREQAERILNAFFDAVIDGMNSEQLLMLRSDFGYFEMREETCSPGGRRRRVPVFKKSGRLKNRLRCGEESRECQVLLFEPEGIAL